MTIPPDGSGAACPGFAHFGRDRHRPCRIRPPGDFQVRNGPPTVDPACTSAIYPDFSKLSPFDSIHSVGATPQINVRGKVYELVALDDIAFETIVFFCQRTCTGTDANEWQKRFDEDIVEILSTMGRPPAQTLTLQGKTFDIRGSGIAGVNLSNFQGQRTLYIGMMQPSTTPWRRQSLLLV